MSNSNKRALMQAGTKSIKAAVKIQPSIVKKENDQSQCQKVVKRQADVHNCVAPSVVKKEAKSQNSNRKSAQPTMRVTKRPPQQIMKRPKKPKKKKKKSGKKRKTKLANPILGLSRRNPLDRPMPLSPQLAIFVGATEMPRNSVVKYIWMYAKERNLKFGKKVHCDHVLKDLLGCSQFSVLELPKLLNAHILKGSGAFRTSVNDYNQPCNEQVIHQHRRVSEPYTQRPDEESFCPVSNTSSLNYQSRHYSSNENRCTSTGDMFSQDEVENRRMQHCQDDESRRIVLVQGRGERKFDFSKREISTNRINDFPTASISEEFSLLSNTSIEIWAIEKQSCQISVTLDISKTIREAWKVKPFGLMLSIDPVDDTEEYPSPNGVGNRRINESSRDSSFSTSQFITPSIISSEADSSIESLYALVSLSNLEASLSYKLTISGPKRFPRHSESPNTQMDDDLDTEATALRPFSISQILMQRRAPGEWTVAETCQFIKGLRMPSIASRFYGFGIDGKTLSHLCPVDVEALGVTAPFIVRRIMSAVNSIFDRGVEE